MDNVKICSHCGQPNHADALNCIRCDHAFRVFVTVSPYPIMPTATQRNEKTSIRYMLSGACFALALVVLLLSGFYMMSGQKRNKAILPPVAMPQPAMTNDAPSMQNWKHIKIDMTPADVERLIGKPDNIRYGDGVIIWEYLRNPYYLYLTFDGAGTVQVVQGSLPSTR